MEIDIEGLVWKLIDLTEIKRDYLLELVETLDHQIDQVQQDDYQGCAKSLLEELQKIQRMILHLDEQFLRTMQDLKETADVSSIVELEGYKHSRLRELKLLVEEVHSLENVCDLKKNEIKHLKIEKLGLRKTY